MPSGTPTLERPHVLQPPDGPAGGGRGPGAGGGAGDAAAAPPISAARIGVWLLVAAITILFAAFTSTYLVRRGEADWRVGPLPALLWVTTALILASTATMERARKSARDGQMRGLRAWLAATTVLGLAFLAGQVAAWRQLVEAGIYLSTNPHSAFFYLLTGAHGLHLAGGIGALLYAWRTAPAAATPADALGITDPVATFWHFLAGLWVYLFLILFGI